MTPAPRFVGSHVERIEDPRPIQGQAARALPARELAREAHRAAKPLPGMAPGDGGIPLAGRTGFTDLLVAYITVAEVSPEIGGPWRAPGGRREPAPEPAGLGRPIELPR